MNIKFYYQNLIDASTAVITSSSQHVNFPDDYIKNRWAIKGWHSNHDDGSGWGNFIITPSNYRIYFNEGAATINAFVTPGTYNADGLAIEIGIQMTAVGGGSTYTCTYSGITNLFTIELAGKTFELEGTSTASAIWGTIGFDEVDTGLALSHEGNYIRIHTDEWIAINFIDPKNFDAIFIPYHNLQTSATFKIQLSNDAFVSIPVEVTLTRSSIVPTKAAYKWTSIQTYQYMRIWIEDIDNPDLYVSIGRPWIGEAFSPTIGFESKRKIDFDEGSIITKSAGGQTTAMIRPQLEIRQYSFGIANPKASWDTFYQTVGKHTPFIALEKPANPASLSFLNPEDNFLYSSIQKYSYRQVAGAYVEVNLTIKEEK